VVPDQGAVEELPAHCADPSFRIGVRDWGARRRADDGRSAAAEDLIEGGDELARTVADQEPDRPVVGHHEIPGGLGGPRAGRVGGDPGEMHATCLEFDEEQHVVAAEQDGVDGEEVTRDDSGRLRAEKRRPGFRVASWCGLDSRPFQDRPHGRRGDGDTETGKLTVDTPVTPGGVLACEAHDDLAGLGGGGGPAGPVRVGPVVRDEPSMPGQDRLRADEEGRPAVAAEHASERRNEHAVGRLEAWSRYLTVQDRELMAQDEDLGVFGTIGAATQ